MKLRTRIITLYTAVAVVGILLASTLSSWQVNKFLDGRLVQTLHSQVDLLADLVHQGTLRPDSSGAADEHLRKVARTLGIRFTLISKDGTVLFDSDVLRNELSSVENHMNRPEIVEARERGFGSDRRTSATVGREFLYAARRITSESLAVMDSGYVRCALSTEEVGTLDRQVQAIVWIVGIITIIVISFVSVKVSARITDPILEIARVARAVQEGDVHQRVSVASKDEISDLARAINDMAEKLGNDIIRLKKLERVRSEFLANVSHELRTPIFSLQGFLETLLDGAIEDPAVNREFIEKAHKHAQRLNVLLNDLIEISRIESGEMKLSFRYFSLSEFLQSMRDEMAPQADKKGVALRIVPENGLEEQVYGDRERLKQVMVNLIDNAIKYTDPGGSVTISVRDEGGRVAVSVEDTGVGIPAEHQSRIFERFYRVDKDRSREVGGTGLGLAIVKHIVEAHGSIVNVESVPGRGSIFSFSLKR
jgi:two-component system phosphate regulon sensor histidine kinase PhoR